MRRLAVLVTALLVVAAMAPSCTGGQVSPSSEPVRAPAVTETTPPATTPAPPETPVTPTPSTTPSEPAPATVEPTPEPEPGLKLVGYITHWYVDRLAGVDLGSVTDIIWQGVEVTSGSDPTLRPLADADWSQISEVVAEGHAGGDKVLVSLVGIWNKYDLNKIWQSRVLRTELIQNIEDMLVKYDADGIDLDNESLCDPSMYLLFIEELYNTLAPLGKIISLAGNPYGVCIPEEAAQYLDFISIMTYDMAKGKGYPYHSTIEESEAALNLWVKAGIPKDKLLIGIPFYGRDAGVNGYDYRGIVQKYNPAPDENQVTDSAAKGGTIWWNGIDMVKQKVDFVKNNSFGGIMVYELGMDSSGGSSLLNAICGELDGLTGGS